MIMQHFFHASRSAFSILFLATPTFAQDVLAQPLMSEPYAAENAQTAMDEIKLRWDAAQQEQQDRFAAFSGDYNDFVRSDPILQNVTWPYEACTDLISLIPPPLDGWGVRSDAPFTQNPIEDKRAEFGLVTFDADVPTNDPAFFGSEDSVSISLSASVDNVVLWNMMYGEPTMRESMYVPGPYNYPVSNMDGSVLFGDVLVRISATDETNAQLYLETMIGCAIAGGMIAEGIDVTTLRDQP
ncbi:hypothetical protein DS901_17240 [Loktanella sp. D2R18]|uniref:hypothetical protein n=2 Tax=Rhodobacterales TaxID=204455 RepID=UPI000DE86924|nr:hypothetical protein [Loktanella sp. D2R18]MDO6591217.1 hypothetical protein [Yoonia sp. 1_MG-2023]RBW41480.1 hypothetical protein DS901_17240 [Loktanella sp. D2R18]